MCFVWVQISPKIFYSVFIYNMSYIFRGICLWSEHPCEQIECVRCQREDQDHPRVMHHSSSWIIHIKSMTCVVCIYVKTKDGGIHEDPTAMHGNATTPTATITTRSDESEREERPCPLRSCHWAQLDMNCRWKSIACLRQSRERKANWRLLTDFDMPVFLHGIW